MSAGDADPARRTATQTRRVARRVMWAAIGGSVALLGALLAIGWDDGAWAAAAGVLLVACVLACAWTAAQGRATDREVRDAVARLAAAREEEQQHRAPERETVDGR